MIRVTTGGRRNRPGSAHSIAWELPSAKKIPLAECEIGSFAGAEPVAGSHIVERENIKSGKIGQSRGCDGKEARMRRAGGSGLVVAHEGAENKQDLSKRGQGYQKERKKKKKKENRKKGTLTRTGKPRPRGEEKERIRSRSEQASRGSERQVGSWRW
jgi:hypothetical protein